MSRILNEPFTLQYRRLQADLLFHHEEALTMLPQSVQNRSNLYGNDGQHLDGDAIELVEASPGACLRQALVDVAARLVVHLLRAVEHVDQHAKSSTEILCRFRFAGTGRTGGSAAHCQMQALRQGDVTSVGQRRNYESRSVAEIFVPVNQE